MSAARSESPAGSDKAEKTSVPGLVRDSRLHTTALAALLLLGVVLRSVQYFARTSLSFDELAVALNIQRHPLSELVFRPLDFFQVAPPGFLALVNLSTEL